jgi:hypothetical protein
MEAAITSFYGRTAGFSPWAASEAAQGEKPDPLVDSRAYSLFSTLLDGDTPGCAEKANSYQSLTITVAYGWCAPAWVLLPGVDL